MLKIQIFLLLFWLIRQQLNICQKKNVYFSISDFTIDLFKLDSLLVLHSMDVRDNIYGNEKTQYNIKHQTRIIGDRKIILHTYFIFQPTIK